MRVVFEVASGPDAGRKVSLGARQVLGVGRTEWADLAVAGDTGLADVHFSLETDHAHCYLQDLAGGEGTQINGQQAAGRVKLRDGDRILAGNTRFTVRIEANQVVPGPDLSVNDMRRTNLVAPLRPVTATRPPGRSVAHYTVERCDTGLTLYRGHVDEIAPQELAVALAQVFPPCLIVDFKKLESGRPSSLASPDYLFDWLDPLAAAAVSPVVLAPGELPTWPALIEEGWGEDAVICFFSRQEKAALLAHLRAASCDNSDPKGRGAASMGFCWPSVMAPLLAHYEPAFVKNLVRGIDAVLVELPDLPVTWQLYGDENLAKTLDRLGFVREENGNEDPATSPSEMEE
jgi:pSer/pThr/pTyr-binding forkhead associated (FHA) protein